MKLLDAIAKIKKNGVLLVYPLNNRPEPRSLWSEFYPRSKMKWEWDSDGSDDRVARLWHLREEISRSGKVVYAKWFQGRATFFSKEVFIALFALLHRPEGELSPLARQILGVLEENSPLSTKEIKKRCHLVGPEQGKLYEKALRELWSSLLIVGFGEIDDGAFPSLGIGATRVLFDTLCAKAEELELPRAEKQLEETLGAESVVYKYFQKSRKQKPAPRVTRSKRTSPAGGLIRYEDLVRST